jgi:hypothetical protein
MAFLFAMRKQDLKVQAETTLGDADKIQQIKACDLDERDRLNFVPLYLI